MKCLALAAGYATRLYPLTKNMPKPLLTVGDRPILDWLFDDVSSSGKADGFIVVSNHKFYDRFLEWAETRPYGITVLDDGTVTNETRLGAVRDIAFAVETLGLSEDLLVVAGDNVLDFSLTGFIGYAEKKKTSCVMRYPEPSLEKRKKCGILKTDRSDRILSMEEKPEHPASRWCCPPFYYLTAADAARIGEAIDSGCGTDAPGSYIAWLCRQTDVHAMRMPGRRYDVGNLESYERIRTTYRGPAVPDVME